MFSYRKFVDKVKWPEAKGEMGVFFSLTYLTIFYLLEWVFLVFAFLGVVDYDLSLGGF